MIDLEGFWSDFNCRPFAWEYACIPTTWRSVSGRAFVSDRQGEARFHP